MSESVWLIIVAVLVAGVIPIVPIMLRLRIRIFRFFRWQRLADWHERNARPIVLGVRLLLAVMAAYLLVLGLEG